MFLRNIFLTTDAVLLSGRQAAAKPDRCYKTSDRSGVVEPKGETYGARQDVGGILYQLKKNYCKKHSGRSSAW